MGSRRRKALFFVACAVTIFTLGVLVGSIGHTAPAAKAARAQAPTCGNSTLSGGYGVRFGGTSVALGQVAAVGLWTFDGAGYFSAKETFTSEKQNGSRSIAGTYVVSADCTFELHFPSSVAREHEADGICVLTNSGAEWICLDNEEGWVSTSSGRKQ